MRGGLREEGAACNREPPPRQTPLSSISEDRLPIVEDVVATLTTSAGAGYGGAAALRAGMRRATDQFDEHAAAALARALVDTLSQSPDNVRVLETLVILGLAHPGALAQHRISLTTEGRRLAVLLEQAGQFERAYCLGELIAERALPENGGVTPESAQAVEQLVRDADFAAARGRTEAAIRCLLEAQRLDPERQDVVRAIRDLRRRREFRKARTVRALKLAFAFTLLSGVGTAILLRETRIWSHWKALPMADPDDLGAMRARLDGIDAMFAREQVWITMPAALLDRDRLRHDIALRARPVLPVLTDVAPELEAQTQASGAYELAEEARVSGLHHAEKGLITEAIADLRRSLELAPAEWVHRDKVQADVNALEAWQKKNSLEGGK
jgi:tetratricopeptide (TPR) repeat protein